MFLPHPRVKVSIVGSLRDREVACSASDRQGSNFESCVWRTVSSQSSHHPQEVLLAQFSLYVHKGGLKPDSPIHFIYSPQTHIVSVKKLRWWLFKKKQAESERLPPSPDALRQAILRAHHQAIIWNLDTVPQPVIPPPENYGWKQEDDGWTTVMTTQLPAPESVLHLVKCGCKKLVVYDLPGRYSIRRHLINRQTMQ